jgi:hypothetical protein
MIDSATEAGNASVFFTATNPTLLGPVDIAFPVDSSKYFPAHIVIKNGTSSFYGSYVIGVGGYPGAGSSITIEGGAFRHTELTSTTIMTLMSVTGVLVVSNNTVIQISGVSLLMQIMASLSSTVLLQNDSKLLISNISIDTSLATTFSALSFGATIWMYANSVIVVSHVVVNVIPIGSAQ